MADELSQDERMTLLSLARRALEAAVLGERMPVIDHEALSERLRSPGASFVTLTRDDQLRGCIGTLEALMPLADDVCRHAEAAALYDYRFPSVKPGELSELSIEVSVLSKPQPVHYHDAKELIQKLRPNVDGVIIKSGNQRATYLPQVWERVSNPEDFLTTLCMKAGLSGNAWRKTKLQVFTYQVDCFHELSVSHT